MKIITCWKSFHYSLLLLCVTFVVATPDSAFAAPYIVVDSPVTAKISVNKVGSFKLALTVKRIANFGNEKAGPLDVAVFLTTQSFQDGDLLRGYPAAKRNIGNLNPGSFKPRTVFTAELPWPDKPGTYHMVVAILNSKRQTYYTATTLSDNIIIRPNQHRGKAVKPVKVRPCSNGN